MSTTAAYGRSRSGDRFYNPPAIRRLLQQQQLQQQQEQQQQEQLLIQKHNKEREREEIRKEKQQQHYNHHHSNHHQNQNHVNRQNQSHQNQNNLNNQQNNRRQKVKNSPENRTESDQSPANTPANAFVSSQIAANLSNLDRFLEHTTPFVPAQYFSKTSMKGRWAQEDEHRNRPYFVLGDLWESFKEWSAYGAGVPLLLNGSDSVVQYYVPYLSGMQLYKNPSKPSSRVIRRPGEESDDSSRETSSAGSSDCEIERRASRSDAWLKQHLVESVLQGMNGLSIRNDTSNGSSSDEGESSSSAEALIFEYFEHEPPFNREPLADKISLLASRFTELKTCKSCDLSPSSWISVAWYPIYRIPTGPTLQNLDSCFLTFHSLSTPVRCPQIEWQNQYPNGFDHRALKLSLPVFGLASYKFRISVWDHNGSDDSPRANALLRAADEWLRLLNVNHPDYRFFISHNYNWR